MLLGHLGVSILAHRYLKTDLVPVVVAGVIPDVIDKTLCQGLHILPSGRMWGILCLAWLFQPSSCGCCGDGRARGVGPWGIWDTCVGDFGGQVPWLYPFVQYNFEPSPGFWEILRRRLEHPAEIGLELALLGWAALAIRGRLGSSEWGFVIRKRVASEE